jgi:GT2 family glycosyltransferase
MDERPASNPAVAVVILNYNGRPLLERFLPSVIENSPAQAAIYVIDNDSQDDSVEMLQKKYPSVNRIVLANNYGFAEGYNQGLAQIESDFYFILNSDVECSQPWKPLLDFLQEHPDVIAVQPKIKALDRRDYFEHAGAAGGWMDLLGYPFCRGRILDQVERDTGQYDQPEQVFWTSGAAMLVRAREFKALGGFDSDYFAHMEEIDWCWRAKKAGWQLWCIPSVSVYHLGGGTLNYQSPQKVYLNFRNNLATLCKNENLGRLAWLLPVRGLLDGLALVSFLSKGEWRQAFAVIRAQWAWLRWLPSLMAKRKSVQAHCNGKTQNTTGRYSGSILAAIFIRKKTKFNQVVPPHVAT